MHLEVSYCMRNELTCTNVHIATAQFKNRIILLRQRADSISFGSRFVWERLSAALGAGSSTLDKVCMRMPHYHNTNALAGEYISESLVTLVCINHSSPCMSAGIEASLLSLSSKCICSEGRRGWGWVGRIYVLRYSVSFAFFLGTRYARCCERVVSCRVTTVLNVVDFCKHNNAEVGVDESVKQNVSVAMG